MKRTVVIGVIAAGIILCGAVVSSIAAFTSFNLTGDILEQLEPAEFKSVLKLNLGNGSLSLLRGIIGLADDADDLEQLANIKSLKLGVFETTAMNDLNVHQGMKRIRNRLETAGWDLFIKAVEPDESVQIFFHVDDEDTISLLLVVLSNEELVVAEIGGNLEQIIKDSLHDPVVLDF